MDSDTKMVEGVAAAGGSQSRLLDPQIFDHLKARIEEDQQVRDELSQIVQRLDRANSLAQGLLSRIHGTPRSQYPTFIAQVEVCIKEEVAAVAELQQKASQHPYYKYNQKWNRTLQNSVFTVLFCGWLGGIASEPKSGELGRLVTIEEVGEVLNIPVNLKSRDAFHLTIEEYLLALIDLTQELARLATNAVTLGDPDLSILIANFVKDIFAGFQVLNLKNDLLRKRVDSVKYNVQRVEDVVYDLSLRGMVGPKTATAATSEEKHQTEMDPTASSSG